MQPKRDPREVTKLDRKALSERFERDYLNGALIIEHRTDGEQVVGVVEYTGGPHGDGSVGIGWNDRFNRTTQFFPASWEIVLHMGSGVLFAQRIAPDTGNCDMPWRECDLYTIVPREVRGHR